jgi:hypothetical protein
MGVPIGSSNLELDIYGRGRGISLDKQSCIRGLVLPMSLGDSEPLAGYVCTTLLVEEFYEVTHRLN